MHAPVEHGNSFTLGLKRSSLEGRVIFKCPHCGGPGVYSNNVGILNGWPGCYAPDRAQQPVGDICPNCSGSRLPDQDRGELGANIPLWLWKAILYLKKCYVALKR